jgi:hypothetical protein
MPLTLLDLPPELLHLIAFELWTLSAQDIAALRAACAYFWSVFPAAGLDLTKWEARMGPRWCRRENRPRALREIFKNGNGMPTWGVPFWWLRGEVRVAVFRSDLQFLEVLFGFRRDYTKRLIATAFEEGARQGILEVVETVAEHPLLDQLGIVVGLLMALRFRRPETAQFIEERFSPILRRPDPQKVARTMSNGQTEFFRHLIALDFDPARQAASAIPAACRHGDPELIRALVACGYDVAARPQALLVAAKAGNPRVVEILLDAGCWDPRALVVACRHHRLQVARVLISRGFDPTADSDAALDAATAGCSWQRGCSKLTALLLGRGCDPSGVAALVHHGFLKYLTEESIWQVYDAALRSGGAGAELAEECIGRRYQRLVLDLFPAARSRRFRFAPASRHELHSVFGFAQGGVAPEAVGGLPLIPVPGRPDLLMVVEKGVANHLVQVEEIRAGLLESLTRREFDDG